VKLEQHREKLLKALTLILADPGPTYNAALAIDWNTRVKTV